jgi:voltage-gated potassium channel
LRPALAREHIKRCWDVLNEQLELFANQDLAISHNESVLERPEDLRSLTLRLRIPLILLALVTIRLLAIFVSIGGIASLFYLLTAIMEFLVARQLSDPEGKRLMQRQIDALTNHLIVAGFGRMGQRAAEELAEDELSFVVIDKNPDVEAHCLDVGYLFLIGDAEEDDILGKAGIERAKGLIVATESDATNAFIVMTARTLNPDFHIVARADSSSAVKKLEKAGADHAIDLYTLGGRRLANTVIRPAAIDFFSTTLREKRRELNIVEVEVDTASGLISHSLQDLALRNRTGANVLVVIRGDTTIPNPTPDFVLMARDRLVAMGTHEQLDALQRLAAV